MTLPPMLPTTPGAVAARLDLHPVGPYLTRNRPGPFTPALACDAFG